MKKINKYLFGAFAALLTAGLFSCVETAPEYEPGTPDVAGCNGLYFPTQEASGDHTIDPTMPRKKTIIVKRDSLKGVTNPLPEVEFPLVSSDTTGVFVVPATAKFADGQQETAFDVTFEKAETAVKYPLTIAIEDPKYKSQYSNNVNYIELSVFCVEWKYFMREDNPAEKALFTYVQNWWDETHQFYLKYYEVGDVRYCVTETLPVVDSKGVTWYGTWGTAENEGEYELEFIWYTKTNYVTVPYQNMGYENGSNGYIYAASEDAYYNAYKGDSYNLSWLVKNYPDEVCYYDGMGGFNFFMYYVTPLDSDLAGKAYSWGSVEAAIAEGYVRIDYSIDVEAYETVEGVVPVEFTLGADVAKVKYALAEGELTAKEAGKLVDAIVADSVANNYKSLTPEETTIGVTAEASGIYTLVAVAFDKDGEAQGSAFTSFTYVTAEDAESYAATFSIGFEPVSSMYAHLGYDGTNSIQYFMYGSGLTAAKIGIYETATVEKYGAEVCANALKAVSDEVLEAINGNGYSTMKAGLNPLTSYTVVAWGTNGYNSKVETVEFVTEGVPYYPTVEEVIGTWVYEGTSYWAGSDETDTLVIAASDNAELGNVMFTTIFGVPCAKNVYATIDTENSAIIIKDEQPFLHSDQYNGEIYFMINGADEVSMKFVEEGHFNSPSAYFGYYVDGTEAQGWFNLFTAFDAKKVDEGASVVAKRSSAFKTFFNETPSTKIIPVGKATDIRAERNPQAIPFKVVNIERPARANRIFTPMNMKNVKL